MKNKFAKRILELPPYPFAELNRKKQQLREQGKDLIDLSIGDPDLPTPPAVVEVMKRAVAKPEHHRYPPYIGTAQLRQTVARWYQHRFDVKLDPETEVLIVIGSKEGIANLHYALVDPQDVVLVPNPGYPVYRTATKFAGGVPYFLPLQAQNHFLPELGKVPQEIAEKAKLLHINYPNNPTAATAPIEFYREAVTFAKKYQTVVCLDSAYSEIYFDQKPPPSLLQVTGGKEVGVEFHSFSKTFNMAGWRLGFAVGNAEVLKGLATIKTNIDSGQFTAIQEAAGFALDHAEELTPPIRAVYQERRDLFIEALRRTGFAPEIPTATFYVWLAIPQGTTSAGFAQQLLEQSGVVCTPGTAFGTGGEGYIRFALTAPKEKLLEAARRIRE